MKDYKTITREKVDADPGAARYMSETHLLEDWSDKLLDLVLNGQRSTASRKTSSGPCCARPMRP